MTTKQNAYIITISKRIFSSEKINRWKIHGRHHHSSFILLHIQLRASLDTFQINSSDNDSFFCVLLHHEIGSELIMDHHYRLLLLIDRSNLIVKKSTFLFDKVHHYLLSPAYTSNGAINGRRFFIIIIHLNC